MPTDTLQFSITRLSLELDSIAHDVDHAALYLGLTLEYPSRVANQQGTIIPNDQWSLVVFDQASTNRLEREQGTLGFGRYRPPASANAAPSCTVQIEVKPSHFSRLLALAQSGNLPSEVQLTFAGTENIDGQVLWNMREHADLKVLGVTFNTQIKARQAGAGDA